jgi:hypothetical protein
LILAALLGITPLIPPRAADASAEPTEFSAERAFVHISAIAGSPRPIGSQSNQTARAAIVAELRALGLEPMLQTVVVPDYYGGTEDVPVVNVMARIAGSGSTGSIALIGHYDTVPETPGANDNAAAVAAVLETARALLAGEQLRNDVILLLTDGEEPAPRYGATAFVAEHAWSADVDFAINLEAIGSGGPSSLIAVVGPDRWVVEQYATAAPHPVAFSYLTKTGELIGGSSTDLAPFREAGAAGLELAYLHGSSVYHTGADSLERVSLRTVQHHGANLLAVTRHVGSLDLDEAVADEAMTFFMVGRAAVIRYPAIWDLFIATMGAALLLVAIRLTGMWAPALRAARNALLVSLGAALAVTLVWLPIAGARSTMGVLEGYLYFVGLTLLIGGVVIGAARRFPVSAGGAPEAAGVVAIWAAFGLLAAGAAPGLGYLFVWPALAGAAFLVAGARRSPSGRWRFARLVVVGSITLVLLIPAIDTFYQLAQPRPGNPDSQIPAVVVIPALLIAMTIELVAAFRFGRGDPPTTRSLLNNPVAASLRF